jgi:hypothetical protein
MSEQGEQPQNEYNQVTYSESDHPRDIEDLLERLGPFRGNFKYGIEALSNIGPAKYVMTLVNEVTSEDVVMSSMGLGRKIAELIEDSYLNEHDTPTTEELERVGIYKVDDFMRTNVDGVISKAERYLEGAKASLDKKVVRTLEILPDNQVALGYINRPNQQHERAIIDMNRV